MRTLLTKDVRIAADVIKGGGIVAFPTETVYGLGADVFNTDAIARIFEAKGRPADNPLITHIATYEQIAEVAAKVTETAELLIKQFFPGPLTVILEKSPAVPLISTAGLKTIGIRMPASPTAREFLKHCATPLCAPSANLSGRPSPTTWEAVREDLDGRIDCILMGEPALIGLESTVVDCTGEIPELLRAGAVSLEDLRSVIPETRIHSNDGSGKARSPGLLHKHYSPNARIVIVASPAGAAHGRDNAFIGLRDAGGGFGMKCIARDKEDYAHRLFEFFRACDRAGIKTIYCEEIDEAGVGSALMDRIRRAARG